MKTLNEKITPIIYNKLVRDNIPEILDKQGKKYEIEVLEDIVYAKKLAEKLCEEVDEFLKEYNAENDEDAIKKLADIVEVVYAIVDLIGVDAKDFEKLRLMKAEKNGKFNKKLLLKNVF